MEKIDTLKNGYVWLDVWKEGSKYLFEPYVVKRDGTGRSAKYTSGELLIINMLINKAMEKYGA